MVSEVPAEEAPARLTPEERRWVKEFAEQVRSLLGPRLRDLRLFGSKVRGDDHDESDIDVLVLVAATAFLDRCRSVVDEVAAAGPNEPDPP